MQPRGRGTMRPRSYLLRALRDSSPPSSPRGGAPPHGDGRETTPRARADDDRDQTGGSRTPSRGRSSPPDGRRSPPSPRSASAPASPRRGGADPHGPLADLPDNLLQPADPHGPPPGQALADQAVEAPAHLQHADPPGALGVQAPAYKRPFDLPFKWPLKESDRVVLPHVPLRMCLGSGIPLPSSEGGFKHLAAGLRAEAKVESAFASGSPASVKALDQSTSLFFEKDVEVMTYQDICKATNSFSESNLAPFGDNIFFGSVQGQKILVKIYHTNNLFEFDEVSLRLLHSQQRTHQNSLTLIGYADEDDKWFLVYQFHGIQSLKSFLQGRPTWEERVVIAHHLASVLNHIAIHDDDDDVDDRVIIPTTISSQSIWMTSDHLPVLVDLCGCSFEKECYLEDVVQCLSHFGKVLAEILGNIETRNGIEFIAGIIESFVHETTTVVSYFSSLMQILSDRASLESLRLEFPQS